MAPTKKYTGSCYIGVAGSELELGYCRDSIERIQRRQGDGTIVYCRATKGYEARQKHIVDFLNSQHDFILLLDHDQDFPKDTLERLRSHGLPFVTGYYMRRRYNPIAPVWFKLPPKGAWPMAPFAEVPNRGQLYKLGASGWGCMLVHRSVFEATEPLLHGEYFVLEDDMDIWPYDLSKVMGAINGLVELVEEQPPVKTLRPALEAHTCTLTTQIRPLRGVTSVIGSDIRFPFYAREAGFILMGDPDVRVGHNLFYPLGPDDFDLTSPEQIAEMNKQIGVKVRQERRQIK